MNRALVDRIANAVLYEGYILYPYRPAVKNRQRWTFGGLLPEAFCEAHRSGDAAANQTECLVRGDSSTTVDVTARFLHLTARQAAAFDPPLADWAADAESTARPVELLCVGDREYHTWQEAEEREVEVAGVAIGELLGGPQSRPFAFPGGRRSEPVPGIRGAGGPGGEVCGVLVREQRAIAGAVELAAAAVADGLFRLTVRVQNRTPLSDAGRFRRDDAMLYALVSAHTILGVRGGEFVSLLDPPADGAAAAAGCRNVGVWPVLVGGEGQTDTILSSPIILYDYPQIAPESPGDFFDGGEIDEMLALRIMTMTDAEKRSMAAVDGRANALLARTEALAREQLLGLHGTVRDLRPAEEAARG
jgi:hypothetical protein